MFNEIKKMLRNNLISKYQIPSIESSLFLLKENGFNPRTIFDIGAYKGEFALLSKLVWKDCEIVCFEPLSQQVKLLKGIAESIPKMKVIEGVVGEEKKIIEFNEAETASSCLNEQIEQGFLKTEKSMNTLVNYISDYNLNKPDLLKIDTQGYEYQVLIGAEDILGSVDVILAELNFIDIHKNVYLAADVINFLDKKDFVLYDIAEIHRRPFDNAIWQTDFIFIKKDSFLRKEKTWK